MKNTKLFFLFFFWMLVVLASCHSSQDDKNQTPKPEQRKKKYISFATPEELEQYLQWKPGKTPLLAAHRGGPMAGYPENCLESFENILTYGASIIECDVSKTKDGELVLFHDDELSRTSTGKGSLKNFTWAELQSLFLRDKNGDVTSYKIPKFSQALEWARNKCILEVDVKRGIAPEEIVKRIEEHKAESYTIIITYDLRSVEYYHKLNSHLMISAPGRPVHVIKELLSLPVNPKKLVAFVGTTEPDKEVYDLLHKNGISAILGTLNNLDNRAEAKGIKVYIEFFENGADILATDNVPLAAEAVRAYSQKIERKANFSKEK